MALPKVKDDHEMYIKLMVGFSVVQVVLALVLFILSAVVPVVWGSLAVYALFGSILAFKLGNDHKAVRVILRVLNFTLAAVIVILTVITAVLGIVDAMAANDQLTLSYYKQQTLMLFFVFVQAVFLFILPIMSAGAYRGRKFDIYTQRIFAVLELVLALMICFFPNADNIVVLGVNNMWFDIFFCLCVGVTVVSSFVAYPIKWRPKSYLRNKEKREARKQAQASAASAE